MPEPDPALQSPPVPEGLEARVRERTRALEAAHALLLRTERMNTMTSLGSGLAHDLKNLVGVVKNYAMLMKQDHQEGRGVDPGDLDAVEEAAAQAADLAHQLMSFGRGEEAEDQDFDAGARAGEVASLLRVVLPPHLDLEVEVGAEPLPLRGDPHKVDQMLVNLVLNAAEAMPEGGALRVAARRDRFDHGAAAALITVEDTGPGMSPEVLDHLFKPFNTTKGPEGGNGLGLASVKGLVDGMRGKLEVRSAPGQGTRVALRLPLAGPAEG